MIAEKIYWSDEIGGWNVTIGTMCFQQKILTLIC